MQSSSRREKRVGDEKIVERQRNCSRRSHRNRHNSSTRRERSRTQCYRQGGKPANPAPRADTEMTGLPAAYDSRQPLRINGDAAAHDGPGPGVARGPRLSGAVLSRRHEPRRALEAYERRAIATRFVEHAEPDIASVL